MTKKKKLSVTQQAFADMYLDIFRKAVEEYNNTNFWDFKTKIRIRRRLRWSQYHYKQLTGKQVTLKD